MQHASQGCVKVASRNPGQADVKSKLHALALPIMFHTRQAAATQVHASIAPMSNAKAQHDGWSPGDEQRSPGGHGTVKDRQNLSFVSVDELPLSTDP